ncbi:MAG: 6,7-dimethyl-8-ribityllumazine synthase [Pelagibacteraceae bacterium]
MKKVLIVSANYYKDVESGLLYSASNILKKKYKLKFLVVPGVFEIPFVISKNIKKFDGFVALGCVIKGQTPHFEFISNAVTQGIMNLSIVSKKPIGNGILTCLNKKQAIHRMKKGKEAAKAIDHILTKLI